MQLEELAITGEEHVHPNSWAIGLSSVPDSWRSMKRLKRLQLQGHTILEVGSSEPLLTWRLNAMSQRRRPAQELYNSSQHQSQRLTALFKQHSQQIISQRREGSGGREVLQCHWRRCFCSGITYQCLCNVRAGAA